MESEKSEESELENLHLEANSIDNRPWAFVFFSWYKFSLASMSAFVHSLVIISFVLWPRTEEEDETGVDEIWCIDRQSLAWQNRNSI